MLNGEERNLCAADNGVKGNVLVNRICYWCRCMYSRANMLANMVSNQKDRLSRGDSDGRRQQGRAFHGEARAGTGGDMAVAARLSV